MMPDADERTALEKMLRASSLTKYDNKKGYKMQVTPAGDVQSRSVSVDDCRSLSSTVSHSLAYVCRPASAHHSRTLPYRCISRHRARSSR